MRKVLSRQAGFLSMVLSGQIGRMLKKVGSRSVFQPLRKFGQLLVSAEDSLCLQVPRIGHIPCSCGLCYLGQTGRMILEEKDINAIYACSN